MDSVAIRLPTTECAAQSGYAGAKHFATKFQRLVYDSTRRNEALSAATAKLVARHLRTMHRRRGSSSVPGTSIPQESVGTAGDTLTLTEYLSEGSYGMVFRGTWDGKPVVVKIIVPQDKSKAARQELLNEMAVQSVAWCAAEQLGLTPNPIPAVIAPLVFRSRWLLKRTKASPAVVMEDVGDTLGEWLQADVPPAPRDFWLVLGSVASTLRALQSAVGFVHADMHTDNVAVAPLPEPALVQIGARQFHTSLRVTLIDFGRACLMLDGKAVRVNNPTHTTNFSALCDNRFGGADLCTLLAHIMPYANKLALNDTAWRGVADALAEVLDMAFNTASGRLPPSRKWTTRTLDMAHIMRVAAGAIVTTPATVMMICNRHL